MKHKQTQVTGIPAIIAIIIGVLCPLCIFAPFLLTVGLGSLLALIAPWFAPALLILVGISLIGFLLSYQTHKNFLPFVLAVVSGILIYYGRYINYNDVVAYLGGALLLIAVGSDWWIRKNNKDCIDCSKGSCDLPKKK